MKFPVRLTWSAVLVLCLCGCASSERMARMSGGVIQEYSAPQSRRIRSERFQKHTKAQEKARNDFVGKVEETPVNIWPFFFSSEYYTAIMWPWIDWDEYGFAVRPFYNMEGDEHSVLFPLSAWNVKDRDGWVLLYSWDKDGWMLFPLAARRETEEELWRYYTPLFIQNKDLKPLTWQEPRRSSFTEFMLGYHSRERQLDDNGWRMLFDDDSLNAEQRRFLAYKLAGTGRAVPANMTGLRKLREDVAATLPVKEEQSVGFIPLFHASWGDDYHEWRALAYLLGGRNSKKSGVCWDVFGPFGMLYQSEPPPTPWRNYGNSSSRSFTSVVLMSYFSRDLTFADEGKYKLIRNLYGYLWTARSEPEFRRALPDIRADLKRLDPTLELPDTVTDGNTLRMYLDDLGKSERFRDLKLPMYATDEGGFVPLFMYSFSENPKDTDWFFTFLGMSYWSRSEKERLFWSIPILTFSGRDESSEWFNVAPPIVWRSKTDFKKRIEVPIHAANTRWAADRGCVSARGDYSLCGLYYRGHMTYYAAKPRLDHRKAEHIRQRLPQLLRERKNARESKKKLETKYRKEEKYRPKAGDEVDACRKQLKLAELRRDLKQLAEEERARDNEYARMRGEAKELGFELAAKFPEKKEQIDAALEKLFDAAAELHSQSDAGSGFFYRRENYHNGDWNWRFCGILAGGEKQGDREHSHVLQFLYRYRRDGKRTEKIYFPFVSIREDEHGSRTSFMGRVWQKTVKDGKSGGYIFFIPYGEL